MRNLALVFTLCAVSVSANAVDSAVPRVIALQTKQTQTVDLRDVGEYLGLPGFPAQTPQWSVTSSPDVTVTKLDESRFTLKINSKGRHSFQFKATTNGRGLPIPVIGYELDRAGMYVPEIVDPNPSQYDSTKPTTMIATLRMDPFVPGVQYDINFFAHKTTFVTGARSFRVVTGDAQTSLGEPGFRIEASSTGTKVGVLRFTMIMPGNESSWCLKTTQTQQWPDLIVPPNAAN